MLKKSKAVLASLLTLSLFQIIAGKAIAAPKPYYNQHDNFRQAEHLRQQQGVLQDDMNNANYGNSRMEDQSGWSHDDGLDYKCDDPRNTGSDHFQSNYDYQGLLFYGFPDSMTTYPYNYQDDDNNNCSPVKYNRRDRGRDHGGRGRGGGDRGRDHGGRDGGRDGGRGRGGDRNRDDGRDGNNKKDKYDKDKDYDKSSEIVQPETRKVEFGRFYAEIFDTFLLTSVGQSLDIWNKMENASGTGGVGILLEPVYKNMKLDKLTEDKLGGVRLDINYLSSGNQIIFGVYGIFNRQSIVENENENKVEVNSLGFGLYGGFNGDIVDIKSALAFGKSEFAIVRNLNYKSKLPAYVVSIDAEIGIKFKITDYLRLRPFFGIQTSILTHGVFSEEGSGMKMAANKYNLTMGHAGIGLTSAASSYNPLSFHINLGAKFKIPNKPIVISTAIDNDGEFKSEGTKNLNILYGADIAIAYVIAKNFSLGAGVGYYGNKNLVRILSADLVIGFCF
jgi:hypothetical protein